ncbi:MAG: hypothetical protein Q8N90_00600 [bacterium]|nr:hypothetical protein [bacterium]
MNNSKKIQNQKGQVLLATVLILMSTFALAITIGGMVLFELKSMNATGESVKALYAAEAGIECRLYMTNKAGSCDTSGALENGTEYTSTDYTAYIRSIGTSNKVNRALEITFE